MNLRRISSPGLFFSDHLDCGNADSASNKRAQRISASDRFIQNLRTQLESHKMDLLVRSTEAATSGRRLSGYRLELFGRTHRKKRSQIKCRMPILNGFNRSFCHRSHDFNGISKRPLSNELFQILISPIRISFPRSVRDVSGPDSMRVEIVRRD